MISTGMASLSLLEDHFIRFFALCGSLQEADQVFSRAQNPNVYAWHAIISAHVTHGDSHMALRLYGHMRFGGIEPDKVVFLSILKACGNIGGIDQGRLTHDHVITRGLDVNVAVGSCLIDMYAKCGSLDEAQRVFDRLPIRDVVLWGSLISAYVHHGQGLPALKLFVKIHLDSIEPDKFIFSSILKACGSVEVLDEGKLVHDHITRSGLESDVVVGSALIDMYAKCNSMQDASTVFDRLSDKNVVSWNALIAGHVQHGHGLPALQLYDKMKGNGTNANKVTFLCVLKACGCVMALEKGRAIHNQLIKNGFESHVPIQSALIDMYAKCGSLQEMSRVFDGMANGDLVSWNATIAGYVQHGYDVAALYLFQKMEENGIKKDGFTLSCALKACSSVGAVEEGRIIHNQIISGGLKSDVVMESSLVVMYAKCGSLQEAHRMFGKMVTPDVVSWNGMISGYVFHGQSAQALQLVEKMQTKGLKPSLITFASILKACKSMESAVHGRLIHDQIVRSGFESEVVPASTLVDMYTNFGNLEEAFNLFDRLQTPNLVTWNVMIAGCAQYGDGPAALQLFGRMQLEGTKPDNVTFLCILQACGSIGSLAQGRLAHDQILRIGLELDPSVGTALVNMYARCGSLDEGHGMLDALPSRNVVSWGALIAGYAQHGNYKLVIQCFMIMQEEGLKPDGTIYSSVLAACSHSGQVDEGHWHFNCMRDDYGITPSIEHFNCMVDLLGRAGCLYEAKKLLQTMPILADVSGWISLLTACKTYRNVELGRYCFNQIVQKDSNAAAAYLLISSIYADAHMWEDVYRISELRRFEGAFKKPGRAWIEISKEMHEFIAGNKVHAESDEIYSKSKTLIKILNCEGYVPHLSLVLEQSAKDRSEEEQCVSDCHSKLLYLSL